MIRLLPSISNNKDIRTLFICRIYTLSDELILDCIVWRQRVYRKSVILYLYGICDYFLQFLAKIIWATQKIDEYRVKGGVQSASNIVYIYSLCRRKTCVNSLSIWYENFIFKVKNHFIYHLNLRHMMHFFKV